MRRLLWVLVCLLFCGVDAMPQKGGGGKAGKVTNGLVAEYPMTDNGGVILRDSSGYGNNGVLGAPPSAPVWSSTGLFFSGSQNVALPVAVSNARTILMFGTLDQIHSASQPFIGMIASAGSPATFAGIFEAVNTAGTPGGILTFAQAKQASTTIGAGFTGPAVWGITTDAAAGDTLYINGVALAFRNGGPPGFTLGAVAPGVWYLGGTTAAESQLPLPSPWYGSINYAVFYNRALSSAEVIAETNYINGQMAVRGLSTTQTNRETTDQLTAIGDSLTQGLGSDNGYGDKPWTVYLTGLLLNYDVNNIGIAGQTAAQIVSRQPIYGAYNNAPAAAKSTNILWAGSNDIALNGTSPDAVWNSLASICQTARALGQKTYVGTMISRSTSQTNPPQSFDYQKDLLDNLILQQGSSQCDGVIDFASFNPIGADAASNQQLNPAYIPYWSQYDQIHLTDLGYTAVAQMAQNRINYAQSPASFAHPDTVTSNAYRMAAADVYLRQNITAAATTTLPDCIGLTGLGFSISNANNSGFVITTLPFTATYPQLPETITGSPVISANTTAVFQVTRGLVSTGGCGWLRIQ